MQASGENFDDQDGGGPAGHLSAPCLFLGDVSPRGKAVGRGCGLPAGFALNPYPDPWGGVRVWALAPAGSFGQASSRAPPPFIHVT